MNWTAAKSYWLVIVLMCAALAGPAADPPKRGGASGKSSGNSGGDGGAGGSGSVIQLPKISPEELAAFKKTITLAQHKLLEELFAARMDYLKKVRGADAEEQLAIEREYIYQFLAAYPPAKLAAYWKALPAEIVRVRREVNPTYLSPDQQALGKDAPADTKELIAKLVGDDVDAYLQARQRLLAIGAPCLPLLANEVNRLGPQHPRSDRCREVFNQIERLDNAERMIRVFEAGAQRLTEVKKKAAKDAQVVLIMSRTITSYGLAGSSDVDPRASHTYYSFPKAAHGYEGAVSLGFGNGGDQFGVNMYGGQQNRIKDLGAKDLAKVMSVPGPKVTAKWDERADAVPGHVYLEHCLEPRDNINSTFAFKVLDVEPGKWAIIEWKKVPQDKDPS